MMNKILIDSDAILDFFFNREPFAEHVAGVLPLCEKKEIAGYVTPVIVSNVYYLLRQTAPQEDVIKKLTLLISIVEVSHIDKNTILQALTSEFRDFEDALQHFSAVSNGLIDVIVTRNLKDYKHSTLLVMTPENYLKTRLVG